MVVLNSLEDCVLMPLYVAIKSLGVQSLFFVAMTKERL